MAFVLAGLPIIAEAASAGIAAIGEGVASGTAATIAAGVNATEGAAAAVGATGALESGLATATTAAETVGSTASTAATTLRTGLSGIGSALTSNGPWSTAIAFGVAGGIAGPVLYDVYKDVKQGIGYLYNKITGKKEEMKPFPRQPIVLLNVDPKSLSKISHRAINQPQSAPSHTTAHL
jgi:hypothetical protein